LGSGLLTIPEARKRKRETPAADNVKKLLPAPKKAVNTLHAFLGAPTSVEVKA
jgi:hypothetical protein